MAHKIIDDATIAQAISDYDGIRAGIIAQGVEVPEGTPTAQYGEKVLQIQGGVPLEFAVVCSLTEPASPTENMLWVYSSQAVAAVSAVVAPAWAEGRAGNNGDVEIVCGVGNLTIENGAAQVSPIYVVQYSNGDWVSRGAAIYLNGGWKIFYDTNSLMFCVIGDDTAFVESVTGMVPSYVGTRVSSGVDPTAGRVVWLYGGSESYISYNHQPAIYAWHTGTIMLAAKISNSMASDQYIIQNLTSPGSTNFRLIVNPSNGSFKADGAPTVTSKTDLRDNAWHSLAVSRRKGTSNITNTASVHVDGVQEGSGSSTSEFWCNLPYVTLGNSGNTLHSSVAYWMIYTGRALEDRQLHAQQLSILNRVRGVW